MAAPTIGEQRLAIGELVMASGLIRKWHPYKPHDITERELPTLLLSPQDARHSTETYGAGSLHSDRAWEGMVYVQLREKGREYEAEQKAEDLIDPLINYLAERRHVLLADGRGFDLILTGDTGVVQLPFGDYVYAGFVLQFRTEVTRQVELR